MVDLVSFLVSTFDTHEETLATLAVILVIHIAFLVAYVTNYFPFVQLLLLLSNRLHIIELPPA